MQRLILDLFCGAGGAGMGYSRAGFYVVGVDKEPHADYPFEFVNDDALGYCIENWHLFDAIHASPPCPRYTTLAAGTNSNSDCHPDLIPEVRTLIRATGLPYIIENVPNAPLRDPITLCGEMFGLDVIRHRLFESNIFLWQPEHPEHRGRVAGYRHGEWYDGPYFAVYGDGGGKGSLADWQSAMGIDWMTSKDDLADAIPPAYSQYIGEQLLQSIGVAA